MKIFLFIALNIFSLTTPNTLFLEDLDNDGNFERGKIQNQKLQIVSNEKTIFESDPEWKVVEVLAGEFKNNQEKQFAVLFWKKGNYGESKPFWVDENDDSYKMHLFLYKYQDQKVSAIWQSSNLPAQNLRTRLFDLDLNGKKELFVIQKPYQKDQLKITSWSWSGWGFTKNY